MSKLATDPPTSEAQRRAMWAASAGHGNLGIPASVGKEFANADPGGKLPARAKDMKPRDWMDLLKGFGALIRFFSEEAEEPEHQGDDVTPKGRAASIAFVTDAGDVLFVKRAKDEKNWPGHWAFPGGRAEAGEEAPAAAVREAKEEIGHDCTVADLKPLRTVRTPGGFDHTTYVLPVKDAFDPKLNAEHSEFKWAKPGEAPEPLHPGIAEALKRMAADVENPSGKLTEPERAAASPHVEHRAEMPESAFLEPASRKYPVKVERDGAWHYDRDLLLAAAREARMHGHEELAAHADAIRKKEFGGADAEDRQPMVGDSARNYDAAGRLHVAKSNISKAAVNPYFGREIPGFDKLGLDPDKTYKLLRDPKELQAAASTFNGLPILFTHKATSAVNHPAELVIGATGNDAEFSHPYLQNSLVIWPEFATEAIEDGEQRQLSCGYNYTPDMTPGVYEGEPYSGVMRQIIGNHVALVVEGRAGPTVAVADGAPFQNYAGWRALEEALLGV